MRVDAVVRKNWIEMQKRHEEPISPIGLRIDPKDQMTLKVWRDEGIDRFVLK